MFKKYNYPEFKDASSHYEAVAWSGIALLKNPVVGTPNAPTPASIENPIFVQNCPDKADRTRIVNIFNAENGTSTTPGVAPLRRSGLNFFLCLTRCAL